MKFMKRIIAVAVIIVIALAVSYLIYMGGTGRRLPPLFYCKFAIYHGGIDKFVAP